MPTRAPIRPYARTGRRGAWELVGEYPTREAAWNAKAAVLKGYAV